VIEQGSALRDMLEYQLAWQVPSPSANLYFLGGLGRQAAADGVEVLLDGEGGDELFGCVPYLMADRVRRGRIVDAFRLVGRLPWGDNDPPWRGVRSLFVQYGLKGAMPHRAHEISRALRRRERLAGPDWLSAENRRLLGEAWDPWRWKRSGGPQWWNSLVDTLTVGRERIGYHDFFRRKAAIAGLEGGHPFLDDLQLIEVVLQLRPEPMFERRYSRPVLREALAGVLPDVVRLRPQKANFTGTVADCFAGLDRAHATRLLTEKGSEIAAFVVPGAAEEVLKKLTDPRYPYYATAITRMVALEVWLRSQSDPDFPSQLLEQDLSSPQYRIVSPSQPAVAS
jgi:asparagine synthetase B (glutamine-hydrolysing)